MKEVKMYAQYLFVISQKCAQLANVHYSTESVII